MEKVWNWSILQSMNSLSTTVGVRILTMVTNQEDVNEYKL